MAKVTFVGDPNKRGEGPRVKVITENKDGTKSKEFEPADTVKAFGYEFTKGESVEVEEELHLSKFRGNNHFEVEEGKQKEPAKPKKETKKKEVE